MSLEQRLRSKIKVLSDWLWEQRVKGPDIDRWLDNFDSLIGLREQERLHALFLLSNFMYFGGREVRELLRAVYRDLVRYPLIEAIRKGNRDTLDEELIETEYKKALVRTRFLGIGQPSESGTFLLYPFRQANDLSIDLFTTPAQIFEPEPGDERLKHPEVERYIFLDDFIGGGTQAVRYTKDIVAPLKRVAPTAEVRYIALLATKKGLEHGRLNSKFDSIQCVFELDDSFRCFSPESRYFVGVPEGLTQSFAEQLCLAYGMLLSPEQPTGYGECQLLLGFNHNTPNNTLPIIWSEGTERRGWHPIFPRSPKH